MSFSRKLSKKGAGYLTSGRGEQKNGHYKIPEKTAGRYFACSYPQIYWSVFAKGCPGLYSGVSAAEAP